MADCHKNGTGRVLWREGRKELGGPFGRRPAAWKAPEAEIRPDWAAASVHVVVT